MPPISLETQWQAFSPSLKRFKVRQMQKPQQRAAQSWCSPRASGADIAASGKVLDLKALVQEVCDSFTTQHLGQSIALSCDLPAQKVTIKGDGTMLHEALLNLLMNTIIHGGNTLSKINVELSIQGHNAALTITDNGIGIPADRHVQAISRFGQAGGGPGSGLGLPIAARVMTNHGGSLEILDCVAGTSIKLVLPLSSDPSRK